ncbi:MAG: sugar ABC transporter ATP-binding protein [Proteobacteria bacterium]|nr:sugar ABC transporter ATP-binding protein [Pseudomonadota bacterium]
MSSTAHDAQGAPDSGAPALLVRHFSKSFGGARALDDVSLSVRPGEVHGLLGQNGSGKSTLIKVLSGYHSADLGGELEIYGKRVSLPLSPGQFRNLGMAFVHQHLALVPSLTVLENLRVGDFAAKNSAYISWGAERRRAVETFNRFDLPIDPDALVQDIPQVERALFAIVRAFEEIRAEREAHGNPGILFLDEPTPFLPKEGVEKLFNLIRGIVREGASVVFVSHDVDEVLEITDRATVLRDGRVAGTLVTAEATKDKFIETIIGRKIEPFQAQAQDLTGQKVDIAITGLTGGTVRDTNIELHKGEVLGLTGLIGSGFEEVLYMVFGATPAAAGDLRINGNTYDLTAMSPGTAIKNGVALLPSDRQGAGGVGELTVEDNVTLTVLDKFFVRIGLSRRRMRRAAQELGARYDVRPNLPLMDLQDLSGGNQQKVLLAKWLQTTPELLLLDEPTQGVDVGARQQVYAAITEAAERGTIVICASTDYEQLAAICDRVLIFARGVIVQHLVGSDVTKDRIAQQTLLSMSIGRAAETAAEIKGPK